MKPITLSWTDFKTNVTSRKLKMQYFMQGITYQLYSIDGGLTFHCELAIEDTPAGDQLDFETNFKMGCNSTIGNVKLEPFADSESHSFKGRGFSKNCPANTTTTVSYQIPSMEGLSYEMSGVEILNASLGDTVHMKVLDDSSGTYSTVPNYQLDEFGITWNVRPDVFIKDLPYSATLMPGMIVAFDYTNSTGTDRIIYINLDLHKIIM